MPAPPTGHLRLIRSSREFSHRPSVWAEAFAAIDWDSAERLSDKPGRTVWRVDLALPGGVQSVVLKVLSHRSAVAAMRSMLHGGRLRRHWRGAARLSRCGFRVARGRALLRGVVGGRLCDVLVMEHVEGTPLIDVLAGPGMTIEREHAIADALGELVSLLDRHRLHSKDLKPSNILVDDAETPTLTIIDSDAVGRRPAHPLLPLALEPLGVGVLPRRALLARVVRSWAWHEWLHRTAEMPRLADMPPERALARQAWRDLERLIARHGDPTPRHNPLKQGHDDPPRVALSAASG